MIRVVTAKDANQDTLELVTKTVSNIGDILINYVADIIELDIQENRDEPGTWTKALTSDQGIGLGKGVKLKVTDCDSVNPIELSLETKRGSLKITRSTDSHIKDKYQYEMTSTDDKTLVLRVEDFNEEGYAREDLPFEDAKYHVSYTGEKGIELTKKFDTKQFIPGAGSFYISDEFVAGGFYQTRTYNAYSTQDSDR